MTRPDDPAPSERDRLAAMCKDAFYTARDQGRTMHQAADDAADAILAAGWRHELSAEQARFRAALAPYKENPDG